MLKISGKTETGKTVYSGVFWMTHTHGVPLDVIMDFLRENNGVVDWRAFYKAARKEGMKHRSIELKIVHAFQDVYGPEGTERARQIIPMLASEYDNSLPAEEL